MRGKWSKDKTRQDKTMILYALTKAQPKADAGEVLYERSPQLGSRTSDRSPTRAVAESKHLTPTPTPKSNTHTPVRQDVVGIDRSTPVCGPFGLLACVWPLEGFGCPTDPDAPTADEAHGRREESPLSFATISDRSTCFCMHIVIHTIDRATTTTLAHASHDRQRGKGGETACLAAPGRS